MELKLLCVLICNFIFQYVMFRAYVYMYVRLCVCMSMRAPTPSCIITAVRYDVQKSILYVCLPPLPLFTLWQPSSLTLYLVFHGQTHF